MNPGTPLCAVARQFAATQRQAWSHTLTHLHTSAAVCSSHLPFYGPYARSREVLDYDWHTHYSPARQALQDEIIRECLSVGCRSINPWLVYTAGVMGAGKSYTMRNLHKRGVFPLERFVLVDPDKIKRALPEMDEYIRENPALAGTLTHKESGYIAEIVEREAMQHSKNVLVDGSLRNVDWYARCFGHIRTEFPEYRIAIIMVTASRERIFARAARRAAHTGREVPRDVLEDTIEQVPQSFATLAPLADITAVLSNDDDTKDPVFLPPMTEAYFASLWSNICAEHDNHDHVPPPPPIA